MNPLIPVIILLAIFALFIVYLLLRDMDRMKARQNDHEKRIAELSTEVQLLKQANLKRISRRGLERVENAQTALAVAKVLGEELNNMLENATGHLEEVHNPKEK